MYAKKSYQMNLTEKLSNQQLTPKEYWNINKSLLGDK